MVEPSKPPCWAVCNLTDSLGLGAPTLISVSHLVRQIPRLARPWSTAWVVLLDPYQPATQEQEENTSPTHWLPARDLHFRYSLVLSTTGCTIAVVIPVQSGPVNIWLYNRLGWYRGFSTKNRSVKGIFPTTYICVKPCKIDNEG
uniref:Uncharacterized protein n=1 Tax=Timema monikensis TaxID=170555 RepID=A0A7R9EL13_9NEOP|nr:unnamed protein product [Timema monikensis]